MAKITRHAIAERSTGWVLNLYYEDGSRRQLSCKSQAHAMQRLQEAAAAPTAEFTLRQAYAKAKDHYAKLQNQQSPLGQFREVMAHFGPDTAVSAVGYAAVKDFQDKLTKAGNSPSTVNAKVAKIRLAREFAVQAGDETMPPIPSNVPLNFVEKDLWTPEQLALAPARPNQSRLHKARRPACFFVRNGLPAQRSVQAARQRHRPAGWHCSFLQASARPQEPKPQASADTCRSGGSPAARRPGP